MTTVESAHNYDELLGSSVAASPYEYATMFKAEGFMARQRAKKRLKLLKAVDFKLRHILERGEKVYFLMNEAYPGENRDIPDPWYGPEAGYHTVYDMINVACDALIENVLQDKK